MTIHDVWYGDSMAARTVRILLYPLSLLYAGGWQIYLLIYRLGIKTAQKPHKKILCIGNLVAGGTGKTPTVVFVANLLQELGYTVVIGCSGYGSPRAEDASAAPEGPLDPAEWGDEPAEIRELLPDIPLIVGRARVIAAKICAKRYPDAVLLMDDGFQHMPLAKDRSIILDPPTSNTLTFPAGPYRESRASGRRRASLVVPSDEWRFEFSPIRFTTAAGTAIPAPPKARVLTAVGRPDNVQRNLQSAGVEIVEFIALPDHDKLEFDLAQRPQDVPWIVTRKDWVKLRSRCTNDSNVVLAERQASIEPSEELKKWLKIVLG
ncbi:MAG: tetraacyldisaccharide 4'-kinase [Armatimonadetes bacterium]|nr:tetraacyldisaccharide 4'-kinase [Armatimonadota bacterium]